MEDTKPTNSDISIPIEELSITENQDIHLSTEELPITENHDIHPPNDYLMIRPDTNIVVNENDIIGKHDEAPKLARQIYCSSKTCMRPTNNLNEKLHCSKVVKAICAECESKKSQFYNKTIYGDLEKDMQIIDSTSAEAQVKPKKERKKRTKKEEVKQEIKLEGSLDLDQHNSTSNQFDPFSKYTEAYERGFRSAMSVFNKQYTQ